MNFTELLKTPKLIKLIVTLSLIAALSIFILVTSLNGVAISQQTQLLTENINNQIRLMRTMQQVENKKTNTQHAAKDRLINTIINQLQINQQRPESDNDSEVVMAKRKADQIIFLLWGKNTHNIHKKFTLPFKLGVAEPMRRALLGESGTYIGVDHKGEKVLAVYRYMPEYKLGIVEKIGLNAIFKPYLLLILFASLVALILVFFGSYTFVVIVRNFSKKEAITTERLRRQHEIMSSLLEKEDLGPCDMQMIFEAITEASCSGLNVSRASIWLFDEDRCKLHCADLYERETNCHDIDASLSIASYPVYFKILQANQVISSSNVYADNRLTELIETYLKPNNITALLHVTIWLNNELIGVIYHEQKTTTRDWGQEDINFTCSIANNIAMAINNCRRNKAEQYLQESEERYQRTVAGSSDVLWDWDLSTNRVYRSPQFQTLLGYKNNSNSDDFDSWVRYLHPDDKQRTMDAMDAHLKNARTPYDVEYRLQLKSGDYHWFRARGIALRDKNNKPCRVSGSITDINELKRIQHSLTRFKQTLGEISDYIFMFDPDTLKFFYANASAINNLGYSETELMQLTPSAIIPEYDEADFRQLVTALVSKVGESLDFESIQQHKNGKEIPVEIHLQYISPANTPPRFVAIVRDITRRKQVETALIAARDEAELANRTKSEFLSSMSHELRTPLNAIMGFAQLLQLDTQLSQLQHKKVNTIYSAGKLLLELINDMLDLAKIEAGHIELSIDSIELETVIRDGFKFIGPLAEEKGIKLRYESDATTINSCINKWVHADNTRIRQVLLNLLSNAIKYNVENGSVYVCSPPAPQGFHRFRVTDSGRGISEQNLKKLFQPFNRLGAQNGNIEGTGIGLVITRKLVELMGGSISVDSKPDMGTSFVVDLPVAEATDKIIERPEKLAKKLPDSKQHNKQYRILVAEDNTTNQELISLQLDSLGYLSDVVTNAVEALDQLHMQNYDLLLTDIHMPDMDGYQLTTAVRNSTDRHIKTITIIAITANVATSAMKRCIEQGMNDCLPKPVNINELQHKLNHWLALNENDTTTVFETARNETQPPVITKPGTTDTNIIDLDVMVNYLGNDPHKHRRFFRLFLDTTPATIEIIHQAHSNRSCRIISEACHKIKSSAHSIGAVQLTNLCQNIEMAAANEDWACIDKIYA